MQAVELARLEWLAGFNYLRWMEPPGYLSSTEVEAHYLRQRAGQAAIGRLKSTGLRASRGVFPALERHVMVACSCTR